MTSFKFTLGILFGFLVTGILVVGLISYQDRQASAKTALWVSHSIEILNQTHEVTRLYKDALLESNTFFITGDTSLATPYRQVRNQIFPLLATLQSLTQDNSVQHHQVDSTEMLILDLISFNDSVLRYPKLQYKGTQLVKRIKTNREFRIRIDAIANSLNREENRILEVRQAAHRKNEASFDKTFYFLLILIAILLFTTFCAIRYNFNKRMKTQMQLEKVSDLFRRLFYDSPIGVIISGQEDGTILDCNHAYCALVNHDKADLIGNNAISLGIVSNEKLRHDFVELGRTVGPGKGIEIQLQPKGKEPVWALISMQFMQIDNRNCILSAIQDVTAQKKAEEKIQQALEAEVELNKLKSNFVTLASHEFRTPLTTILSSAALLENYATGEVKEKTTKHVTRIKSATNSLTSILDEFLSLTKIEEGRVTPKPERINLKNVLEHLCQNFKSIAKTGQNIIYHHEGESEVYSDPVLISNIIHNLVSNAIKYSGDNTKIEISTKVNSRIHLSVKDTGIGISPEDQEHLFERFFRASNSGNIQGTGLGLHILKHYVDMLHGSVSVNSTVGKGSEFTIILDHSNPIS
jgi:PAS domain S-box-containing protein